MKFIKIILTTILFVFLSNLTFSQGECLGGGCTGGSQYPSSTLTSNTNSWTVVSTLIWAGDYAVYNVTNGSTYEWSFLAADGGFASYDAQLTLLNSSGTTIICFSDDYSALLPKIQWTATFTGTVRVYVTLYSGVGCLTNMTSSTLVWRCSSCGSGSAPANDNCSGATTVSVTANCSSPTNGTISGATNSVVTPCVGTSEDDVWYKFTTSTAGYYDITVVGSASFDAVIDLRSGACNGTNVTCADNTNSGGTETISALLSATTTYYVRIYDYWSYTPSSLTFTICVTKPAVCTPIYSTGTSDGDFINRVQLGSIDNTPGGTGGISGASYNDYYSSVAATNLQAGSSQTLNVTVGTYGSQTVAAWIDYNQDGDFSDAGENLGELSNIAASSTAIFNFTVSITATSGNTRMRVRTVWSDVGIDPCASYSFGEAEDYKVNIVPCTTPGTPVSLNTTSITSSGATLNWSAGTPAGTATVTYYWAIGAASNVTYDANYLFRGTTTSLTASQASLSEGNTYYWAVKAVTSCNSTASSYAAAISFKACTTPGTPTLNAVSPLNPTDATLNWTANATAGSPVVTYKWAIWSGAGVNYETNYTLRGITTSPTTNILVTGLNSNTLYYWTVKAESGCNSTASAYPAAGSFTTPCQTPGTPTSMNTSAITSNSSTLNWAAGTPVGTATVTYYWAVNSTSTVDYETNYIATFRGTTTSTSVALPTTLSAATTYYWVVKAVTSCNSTASSYPTALPFTTVALTPLRVWTGATSSEWNLAGNWSPSDAFPAATDHVIIPNVSAGSNRYPITTFNLSVNNVTASRRCLSLTIDAGATVTLTGGTSVVYISGNVEINGTLNHECGTTNSAFQINSGGKVTVNSGAYLNIGSSSISGGLPAGTISTVNDLQINAGGQLITLGGNIFVQDALDFISTGKFRQEGGIVSVCYSGVGTAATDKVSVPSGCTFQMLNGTFRVSGDVDGTTSSWDAVWFGAGSTIDIQGGTVELLNGTTSSDFTLSFAQATSLKNLVINKTGKSALLDGYDVTINGDITISSGTFNANGRSITAAGNWTNNGGTFSGGSGTTIFTGSDKQINGSAINTFSNLTFNSGANYTFNPSYGTIPQATVSGTFTFNTGANLTLSSGKVIELNGTSNILNGIINTTNYDGTCDIRFNNTTVGLSGTGTINADLQVTSGTTTLGSNFTFSGDLLLNTGTLDLSTRTLTLAGNFTNNGTLTASTGTINFTGSGKLINGSNGTTFNIVNFNSGASYTINPSYVTIPQVTFNGNLTINSNASLTLSTSKILNLAGASNTINGTLTAADKLDGTRDIGLNNATGQLSGTGSFNADLQVSSGTTTLMNDFIINGDFLINTGTFVMTSHTFTINGNYTNNGTFTHGTGTIIFAGTSKNITGSAADGANSWLNNITIPSAASYTFNPTASNWDIDGSLNVSGTLNLSANKYLDIYSSTVGGESIVLNGTITAATANDGTRDVDINSTVNLSGNGSTTADLRIYSGTTTLSSDFILGAGFEINSGAGFTMTTHAFSVESWKNRGTFTAGTGTVKFTGSAYRTVDANCNYSGSANAASDFYNVEINRGADTLAMYNKPMRVANNFSINNGIFSTSWHTDHSGTVGQNRRLTIVKIATIASSGKLFIGYWKACGAAGEGLPCGTSDSLNIPVFLGDLMNYGAILTNRPLLSGYSDMKLTGARITGAGNANEFGVDIQPEDNSTVTQVGPVDIEGDLIIQDPSTNLWESSDPDNVLTVRGNFYLYGSFTHNGTVNIYGNMTNGGNTSNTVTINASTFNFYQTGTKYFILDKNPTAFGQVNIKSGTGTRQIRQNISLTGDLTIESGSTLDVYTTNSNITLSGANSSWYNNGTFTQQLGTVTFSGNGLQVMGGLNQTTFYNLTMNKGNSSELTLGNIGTVNNVLTLTAGFMTSDAARILKMSIGSTTTPSGGSSTCFVKGPVKKVGNTSYIFPIGKGSTWARLEMQNVSGENASDEFTAEYFNSSYDDPDVTVDPYQVTSPLHHASGLEYWNLSENVGAATKKIALYSESISTSLIDAFNDPDLTVAHWNNTSNKWENVGTTGNSGAGSSGWILSDNISSFSPFTFGSKTGKNPLPIELLTFNATANGKQVDLNWTTASEINNDYFTIEKSKDFNHTEIVGKVPGAGNSNSNINYFMIDKNPYSGISYYRLKQTDFDGKFTYSEWVAVEFKTKEVAESNNNYNSSYENTLSVVNVYPNPTKGDLFVTINSSISQNIRYTIFDLMGKQHLSGQTKLIEGISKIELNIENLKSGTYLLVIYGKSDVIQKKIIKQ